MGRPGVAAPSRPVLRPVLASGHAGPADREAPGRREPATGPRVLLASDSPALLAGMSGLLRAERLPVVAAQHAFSALRRAFDASSAEVLLVAPTDELGPTLRRELRGVGPRTVLLLWSAALKIHGPEVEQETGSTCLPLTAAGETVADALRGHAARSGGVSVATELVLVGDGGRLTPREQDVLRCLSRGLRNRQIGEELGLAEETVKGHLKRIFRKLGVCSRTEAVATYLARTA